MASPDESAMHDHRATEAPRGGGADMPPAPGFRHRFVHTPGLTSHVAVIGEGEPIVMLHGLPEHWWQWRTIGAALGQRNQVICPDLRGFGWTRAESPGMGRLTQTDDLLALSTPCISTASASWRTTWVRSRPTTSRMPSPNA